ncbi:MAG: hypothetical protein JKY18_01775 [Flavobacteriales bacterium]|nr:hypothetical protein [Flavobacteriales bacterium]
MRYKSSLPISGYKLRSALGKMLLVFSFACLTPLVGVAQCPPTISLSAASASIVFDDFGDLTGGVTRNGITNISINAGAGCVWDLYAVATLTQVIQYSPNGAPLTLGAVDIRAYNFCETPNHLYAPDPARITGTFASSFSLGTPNYMVGTLPPPVDGAAFKTPAPCLGTAFNSTGTALGNPTTHTFRIDIRVTPGVTPIVEPGIYDLAIDFFAEDDAAPPLVFNLASFNLQIEILPIMQLKMSTKDQVDFIFSDIADYAAGITRYGATVLSVSSSLDWDLMAVGTSSINESTSGGSPNWDQNLSYSALGSADIPLRVLELHQIPDNPTLSGVGVDYSPAFTIPPSGNNYITVGSQGLGGVITFSTAPIPPGNRTIAGNWGDTGPVHSMIPGSYVPIPGAGPAPDHRYVISYRITPGLPVRFNGIMVVDAQPGYYTMQIRYLLSVDQ